VGGREREREKRGREGGREGERGRERERVRKMAGERESEKEGEKGRENCYFSKGMTGALAPFSYLVSNNGTAELSYNDIETRSYLQKCLRALLNIIYLTYSFQRQAEPNSAQSSKNFGINFVICKQL
jgi:hypothetical protein